MPSLARVLVLPALLAAALCAGAAEITLPLKEAWFDGQRVNYISTDVSDPNLARKQGLNYVPALADALKTGPVEKAYKFPNEEQGAVLPSIPRPLGADNADKNYHPFWVLVMVKWKAGVTPHLLNSEEAVLAAAEKGEVELTHTRIVVNWPVVRVGDTALPGVH